MTNMLESGGQDVNQVFVLGSSEVPVLSPDGLQGLGDSVTSSPHAETHTHSARSMRAGTGSSLVTVKSPAPAPQQA